MHVVRRLDKGDLFGEVAVVLNCHRTATVQACHYGMYGRLAGEETQRLLEEYPLFEKRAREQLIRLADPVRVFLGAALRRVDYFKESPQELLMQICFSMHQHTAGQGAIIQ